MGDVHRLGWTRESGIRRSNRGAPHVFGTRTRRTRPLKPLFPIVAFAMLFLGPCAASFAFDPNASWPAPGATDIAPRTVILHSADPFTPAEIGRAAPRDVPALLFLPQGASPTHRVPAVVLLHGSVGNYRERARRYGPPLASLGVAVLVPETYAARADLGRSFIGRALHITETMFDDDAYAGLRALAADPAIDASHVAIIGFSYGGMAAEYALQRTVADRFVPPSGPHFVGHVAYYAPCIARFADRRTTGAPLLMMYGGKDQLIHSGRCAQEAADLRAGGSAVTITVFPDAVHQWDGEMAPRLIGRHLADCAFRVDRDGTVHDATTGIAMTGPLTRGLILAACTGSRPWPIGRNAAVTAQSNRDLERFLGVAFAARTEGSPSDADHP